MTRFLALAACLWLIADGLVTPAAAVVEAGEVDEERPNIVVVMVDDLGAGAAQQLFERLPSIKARFLDQGIRFTRAHGETPLCCPGRAGFLSGRHTHGHGITQNHPAAFDQSMTLATALNDAGYWTMLVGKYFNNPTELTLPPQGWDRFEISPSGFQPAWVAQRAPEVLAEAPADQPIFALITPTAPHNASGAYVPKASPIYGGDTRCRFLPRWNPPSYNEADVSDKPLYTRGLPMLPHPTGWPLRRHCEQLLSVDDAVRRTEEELARQGRLDDTLWLIMSDNGMTYGEHRWPFKLSPYSTRLPLWASWPAGRGVSPRTEDLLVSNIDLGPTLAALAGAEMSWADGVDWSPLLRDESVVLPRESILISLPDGFPSPGPKMKPMAGWWGVVSADDWLFVQWATGEQELYDLTNDPWMLVNQAGAPALAERQVTMSTHLLGFAPTGDP